MLCYMLCYAIMPCYMLCCAVLCCTVLCCESLPVLETRRLSPSTWIARHGCRARHRTVLPQVGAQHMLPYLRWLDYCSVSVLVAEKDATQRMPAVVRALQV